MRFEQKHRESKLTSKISGSFKNIIHTLAIKAQLKFCHQLLKPLRNVLDYSLKYEEILNNDFELIKHSFSVIKKHDLLNVNSIDIRGTLYKIGGIIVGDCEESANILKN